MIEKFLKEIVAEKGRSELTASAYGRDLRQFAGWRGDGPRLDPGSVTLPEIRAWLGDEAAAGARPATLRRKAESLRAFLHWGMQRGLCVSNPAADLTLAKLPRRLPDIIREEDMEKLLAQLRETDDGTYESARRRMALVILYSLGLRQAELLGLRDCDINAASLEMKVTGKRDKQRVLPVPPDLMEEIEAFRRLRDLRHPGLPEPRPLMAGPHGVLSKDSLYRMVRDALAGVSTGRRSPHTLRHTFATAMLDNDADLDAVREMLGHASLGTTQIYTHLSARQILKNYSAHPRARENTDEAGKQK